MKQNSLTSGIITRLVVLALGTTVLGWQWTIYLFLIYKLLGLTIRLVALTLGVLFLMIIAFVITSLLTVFIF